MQFDQLKRRAFITLLGGAAASLVDSRLPLEAQQTNKIYRLGVLSPSSASIDSIRAVTLPELAKAGFMEGQNLVMDARVGVESQISELARTLVASNLDAIIAVSDISIEAAKAASGTIPVVMSFGTGDPVAAGFAMSITRPGGNITGVVMLAPELNAKRLTLLHEAMPAARRIAALAVSEHRYETILRAIHTIAAGAGFELPTFFAETPGAYPAAFTAMRSAGVEALIIVSAPEFNRDAEILAALAIEARLPTVCEWSHMAAQGCLFGYGPSQTELRRRTADYEKKFCLARVQFRIRVMGNVAKKPVRIFPPIAVWQVQQMGRKRLERVWVLTNPLDFIPRCHVSALHPPTPLHNQWKICGR
jgi:putative ABC transport system substrate-binding protein